MLTTPKAINVLLLFRIYLLFPVFPVAVPWGEQFMCAPEMNGVQIGLFPAKHQNLDASS